jgi:hypothetical protein
MYSLFSVLVAIEPKMNLLPTPSTSNHTLILSIENSGLQPLRVEFKSSKLVSLSTSGHRRKLGVDGWYWRARDMNPKITISFKVGTSPLDAVRSMIEKVTSFQIVKTCSIPARWWIEAIGRREGGKKRKRAVQVMPSTPWASHSGKALTKSQFCELYWYNSLASFPFYVV